VSAGLRKTDRHGPTALHHFTYLEKVIMKIRYLLLLAAVAATTSLAAGAAPSPTDEARAEAGQRIVAPEHATSLRPLVQVEAEVVRVTDTDSARQAAGQASARQVHDAHLSEVLRAGSGIRSAPVKVTDTDSARAAAGQNNREQQLRAEYADYVKMQERALLDAGGTSNR